MLGKITIDNSVIYVSKDDQTHSEQSSPNSKERKNASNIKLSRNIEKKTIKNRTGQGFGILKRTTTYYF